MKHREIYLILGKSGSGKTTLCKKLIKDKERLIVFDTISEYREDKTFEAVYINNIWAFLDYLSRNLNKKFRIVFDPEDPEEIIKLGDGQQIDLFDLTCKIIYECLSDVVFAVEEVANFISPAIMPKYFRKLIRYGRHSNISGYFTSQRPADISPHLRAQATVLISFKQHEPRDIQWLKAIIGEDAEKLKDLGKHKYRIFKL